jgi:hypothetical protein
MFEKDRYYSVTRLTDGMAEVRRRLSRGADDLNWLFLSTSGPHGSYATLDEREAEWDGDGAIHSITVLLVQPRTVRAWYGDIPIDREDIPWLREQVKRTLAGVSSLQEGNFPHEDSAQPT